MTTDPSGVADGNSDIPGDSQGLDEASVAKGVLVKQSLIRTGTKVAGLFTAREGNGEAGEGAIVDQELDDQIGMTGASQRPIEPRDVDMGDTGDVDASAEASTASPLSWMDGHMTKAVTAELIGILQSDADLDAEVAAAIEVSSLLDAVALLAKFDRELAQVESVLVAE